MHLAAAVRMAGPVMLLLLQLHSWLDKARVLLACTQRRLAASSSTYPSSGQVAVWSAGHLQDPAMP